MFSKKIQLGLLIFTLAILSSACSISTSSSTKSSAGVDSSIFVSSNSGSTWKAMTSIPVISGVPRSIKDINVNLMTMDPQDSKAVYLASFETGLFFTYNISEGWTFVKTLPAEKINDVKVDPKNKCVIYAAISNRLYRSKDCARTWSQVYFDNNAEVSVKTITIDHYNTQIFI